MSEKAHSQAVIGLLDAALPASVIVEHVGDIRARGVNLPEDYVEVHVLQRLSPDARLSLAQGREGRTGWRVLTRVVSTDYEDAQNVRLKVAAALLHARFDVDGKSVGPVFREATDNPIAWDDGRYSGLSYWAYVA